MFGVIEIDAEHGKAHIGKDPTTGRNRNENSNSDANGRDKHSERERRGHPDRAFDRSKDGRCKWCRILDKEGNTERGFHWNDDCRKKAQAKAKLEELKKRERKGKAF